jgi:putative CocE/NonD family hydrolase
VDRILANQPLKVPTLYVHGLWDQEDIYGAIAAYEVVETKDTKNDSNFLVIGPWNHGGSSGNSLSLGPIVFGDATGVWFRHNILLPFLNEHLKDEAPHSGTPPVLVYETGSDTWQSYDSWPLSCESGCSFPMKPLYLQHGFGLDFTHPKEPQKTYDSYISDPMNPVPYHTRPIMPLYARNSSWGSWLVGNQNIFSKRSDVLTYRTGVLEKPVKISGLPIANLFASTSGSDVDFVVKLIDEYPESYPIQPGMADYQLMISADILRGRYRKDLESPTPVTPGEIDRYQWILPAATHVFQPGHRIMVQIQSSWFPLYDRNPQTYVENIFHALPEDYKSATQKIYRSGGYASFIELPIVE